MFRKETSQFLLVKHICHYSCWSTIRFFFFTIFMGAINHQSIWLVYDIAWPTHCSSFGMFWHGSGWIIRKLCGFVMKLLITITKSQSMIVGKKLSQWQNKIQIVLSFLVLNTFFHAKFHVCAIADAENCVTGLDNRSGVLDATCAMVKTCNLQHVIYIYMYNI